jgi:ubiquinone/menaquinone biosynthesis C-methylase UbiE
MSHPTIEHGSKLNWDAVSEDYLRYRNGYPESFFNLLTVLGIGLPGQKILDLGTGTGALSIPFAQQGAEVTGLDQAAGQIAAARDQAKALKLSIKFLVSEAEKTKLPGGAFDVVTASQCWSYFDKTKVIQEVNRILKPQGTLLVSSLRWVPQAGTVTEGTEELIARYNPDYFNPGGVNGEKTVFPDWAQDLFSQRTQRQYTETIPYTKDDWRGRIRASRWIGASLPPREVKAFDRDHQKLLERAPEVIRVQHRIRVELFQLV